ncbi:MAG: PAS domain-containing protein [Puniceicoccales bacterium]|jgi:nitrogen fixation/metabolism regulation signal transduction histidine kinase|nr:PAS domain-containing protein [Puniceicoccales bacterium]
MNDDGVKKLFDKVNVLEVADLRNLIKHLWKQRDFFKKTFDIIRDSIVVINAKGEIFYCNQSACDLLGISNLKQSNVLWKYIPEFVVFSDLDTSSIGTGNSFLSKEIKISYPHKSILNVTVAHYSNYDDNEKLFVLRIVDITEDRVLSEKTINDEKISSITLLASAVAHEIGNPLNAISLRLQLMQRQCKSLKNVDERMKLETSAGICLDEIARLDSIVKNFLQAIRPQKPKFTSLPLGKVIEDTIDLMEAEFKSLNIEVVNRIGPLPLILGDYSQLKQVFFNVLKNSCEAISSSGTIVIEGSASDNDVILTFTDNGVGIPYDLLDKIFQPYFSTKREGNGLGMVIIERILREHGATIDIASAKNVGTKISINFPRKDKCMPLLGTDDDSRESHVQNVLP